MINISYLQEKFIFRVVSSLEKSIQCADCLSIREFADFASFIRIAEDSLTLRKYQINWFTVNMYKFDSAIIYINEHYFAIIKRVTGK